MEQKSMKKRSLRNGIKFVTSLPVGLLFLAGMSLSAFASEASDVPDPSNVNLLTAFWSDLIDWFRNALAFCFPAYYSPDTGLTLLGVIVVSVLAFSVLICLISLLFKSLRFGTHS